MTCSLQSLFGNPGQGLHAVRFAGLAAVDLALTLGAAALLARRYRVPLWKAFFGLWLLGVALHKLFCVRTPVTAVLFGS